jgi:3-oxoacyl-[acyl-carrier protein] reductase
MNGACAVSEFSAMAVGQEASLSRVIEAADVDAFARLSGDFNPLHMEDEFARQTSFRRRVVHGMLLGSFVSTLIGMHLPGPGALWAEQRFQWRAPVFIGDTVRVLLRIVHKSEGTRTMTVEVTATNQHGNIIMEGNGTVKLLEIREKDRETPLAERVVLVTGGAQGIGAAVAGALVEAGAAVVVNYRASGEQARALCDRLQRLGGRAMAFCADATDAGAVARMLEAAAEEFGRPVDVLINNAADRLAPREFSRLTWDDVEDAFARQLKAAFVCTQAVIPGMVARRSGVIVNIGSAITWDAPPAQAAGSAMAKAALKSMTKAVAQELGPLGVRVNLVSPGLTETDALAEVPERLRKLQAMQTPLRRLAAPEDVAAVVTFLCSSASRHMTGVDVPVCGGAHM